MNGLCICSEASNHIVISSSDDSDIGNDDMSKLLSIERRCERIQQSRSSTTRGNYCYYCYRCHYDYYYRVTYM